MSGFCFDHSMWAILENECKRKFPVLNGKIRRYELCCFTVFRFTAPEQSFVDHEAARTLEIELHKGVWGLGT